jgi:hypothetical protein
MHDHDRALSSVTSRSGWPSSCLPLFSPSCELGPSCVTHATTPLAHRDSPSLQNMQLKQACAVLMHLWHLDAQATASTGKTKNRSNTNGPQEDCNQNISLAALKGNCFFQDSAHCYEMMSLKGIDISYGTILGQPEVRTEITGADPTRMSPTTPSWSVAVLAAKVVTMPRNSPPTFPVEVTNAPLSDCTSNCSLARVHRPPLRRL